MHSLGEQFPANLVRVIRNVKRKLKSGKTVSYKRTFHVRQAQPGDRYSTGASKGNDIPATAASPVDPGAGQEEPTVGGEQERAEQQPVFRIAVQVLGPPWAPDDKMVSKEVDPVPADIRKKYDPKNMAMRASGPVEQEVPFNTVVSGDPILWGVDEVSVLDRMRSGRISRLRIHSGGSGTMMADVVATDGLTEKIYLRLDALTPPWVFQAWGELYGLRRGKGDTCKRAAASYEAAKGFGLDDLVPPTVLRFEDIDAFDSILPDDLMERRRVYAESLARRTGENPGVLKKHIKGFGAAQMYVKDTWTVVSEDWVHELFSGEDKTDEVDSLNRIYVVLPEDRRVAFLRAAVLDFLLWTADRHLGDVLFSKHDLHPVVFMASEVSMPNPGALAMAALGDGGSVVHPGEGESFPILWSDFVIMMAARGTDAEMSDYEALGIDVAGRMTKDRMVEIGRTLTEHGVPNSNTAAVLMRAKMLGVAAKKIARNPMLAALHFAHLMGDDDPELLEERDSTRILEEVNEAMKMVAGDEFDFVSALKKKPEDRA